MKNNKIQSVFTLLALGVLLFAGCQKDGMTTLRLRIADFASDSKVYLDGNTPRWVAGDEISINGERCTIASNGTTTVNSGDGNYKAVYPNSITSFASGAIQLSISQNQSYRPSGNNQVIDAPMAANANAATSGQTTLTFKNIGALLAVTVKNNPTVDRGTLIVDKITVQASDMPLYGTATLVMEQLTNGDYQPVYTINSGQDTNKTIYLNCGSGVSIAPDATHKFYISVPAAPASASNKFTIKVHAYNNDGEQSFTLSQTRPGSGNIGVNQVANVPFLFSQATASTWQSNDIPAGAIRYGVFSVSATQQVYFSAGNLQYYYASSASNRKFRIAEHQWDYVGGSWVESSTSTTCTYGNVDNGNNYVYFNPNTNITLATNKWLDLFGWGTSGYGSGDQAMPWDYSNSKTYGNSSNILDPLYDWGKQNTIWYGTSNTDQGTWRILTSEEWSYLLITRIFDNDNSRKGIGWSYSLVKVNDVPGMLIYPDGYSGTRPSTHNSFVEIDAIYPGCAFLPCAGQRGELAPVISALPEQVTTSPIGYGYYWAPHQGQGLIGAYSFPSNASGRKYLYSAEYPLRYGFSVRLVSDVPASSSSK